jgi:hypothetical protein
MKRVTELLIVSFLLTLIMSCGPSQREKATGKINIAKQLIVSGDTLSAIGHLDSIAIVFPKAESQIAIASNIRADLYRQMADSRKLMIIRNDSIISSLEEKFNIEKTRFDLYTQYHHKRQTLARTWDRSFLQVHLDERGVLYLSSNYVGKEWLNHTGIRVYDGDLQALSERVPLDDPLNHRSDFLDYKWEKVSYMDGKADSVINFIADNPELDIKCVFLGNQYHWILLEDYDIQAVVDARNLAELILLKTRLEEELAFYESKLD